jgi:hypothetical protein
MSIDVVGGADMTKAKRVELFGKVAGGSGSTCPETYQRQKIVEGTGVECPKTNMRINLRNNTLLRIAHPNRNADGFDYTEDFDGVQTLGEDGKVNIYVNLKCVVGKGGSQTRSLREVYWFVEGQLRLLSSAEHSEDVFFANILDGDEATAVMPKFTYLVSLPEYAGVRNKVYVGDLRGYLEWFPSVRNMKV